MNDLDRQVAEAMGYIEGHSHWQKPHPTCRNTDVVRINEFNPSTSYDQIIACIDAKGWWWRCDCYGDCRYAGYIFDFNRNTVIGASGNIGAKDFIESGPEALCRAFLAACEQKPRKDNGKFGMKPYCEKCGGFHASECCDKWRKLKEGE